MKVPFNDLWRLNSRVYNEYLKIFEGIMKSSSFIGGEQVKRFEQDFARFVKSKHCIACANGTDAIQIAIQSLGLPKGLEVILPTHTWVSTAEAVVEQGLIPVFCDSDENSLIDPKEIELLVTDRTSAIIVVHLAGLPCDLSTILKIAAKFKLRLIEDCAQAHGSLYKGSHVGVFSDLATFSFYPGKSLGAIGDAGCIITNDIKLSNSARLYSNHGGKGIHDISGINSRMDTLQAAFLSIKLVYFDDWQKSKKLAALRYNSRLKNLSNLLILPSLGIPGRVPSWHLYMIRTKYRAELAEYLAKNGIDTNINYARPLHKLTAFKDYPRGNCINAELHCNEVLSLPIFPFMENAEIDYVCNTIEDFFKNPR